MRVMRVDKLQVMPDPLGLFFGKVERQNLVAKGDGEAGGCDGQVLPRRRQPNACPYR